MCIIYRSSCARFPCTCIYKQCGCSGCLSYHGYVASDVVCHNVSEAKLSSDMQAVQTWHGGGREGGRDDECVSV